MEEQKLIKRINHNLIEAVDDLTNLQVITVKRDPDKSAKVEMYAKEIEGLYEKINQLTF